MIDIVLYHPQHPGNVGAVCRAMKNFGFSRLVLIDPEGNVRNKEARVRAKHAVDVLTKAKIRSSAHLKIYDYVIGSTAKKGSSYNVLRTTLTVEKAMVKASRLSKKKASVALLFGSESHGLPNSILEKCDMVFTISTAKYATLNLSHAVTIALFELSKQKNSKSGTTTSAKEREVLHEYIFSLLDPFTDRQKKLHSQLWKKIIGRAELSQRELNTLCGFFRKLK